MRTLKVIFAAASVFASSATWVTAQPAIFGDAGTPAWSRMFKYFETRLVGQNIAKDDAIFILPTATDAAWDDRVQILRLMEMYKWGDWMPADAWLYAPNAGKRVSDGYRYFLDAAWVAAVDQNGTASPELKNAMKRAFEELEFTRADYNATTDAAEKAFANYARATPAPDRKTRKQYYSDQRWDTQIAAKKKRLDDAAGTFDIVTASLVDPDIQLLKDAKLRLINPKQKVMLPPVREVANDKDRWQSYYISLIDKDIFAFLQEAALQTQMINESQAKSEYFEQRWSASVDVSFLGLFRSGGASAEQVKRESHVRNNATSIQIQFANIDTFNVTRGEWFSQNVIDRFASKLNGRDFNNVFGPNGQLEFIPKTVLVGRGMRFVIYADSQSIDYLYEHFHAGADAGFYIGYWRVGVGGDTSTTRENTQVNKFSDRIEFVDLSGRGKVLAVLAKHPAGTITRPAFLSAGTERARIDAITKIQATWTPSNALSTVVKGLDAVPSAALVAE